jgi:hypothetical protein
MRRLIWSIVKPLFLHRQELFVTKLPGDERAATYERVTIVPTPGPEMLPVVFGLCALWYGAFLCGAYYALSHGFQWYVVWAALTLALNATLRISWKYKEKVADLVAWPIPVGRRRTSIRILAIAVGAILGAISGLLLDLTGVFHMLGIPAWPPIVVTAIWEGWHNSRRVGMLSWVNEPDLAEHQRWYRVSETTSTLPDVHRLER